METQPTVKRKATILKPTNYGKDENSYKHLYIVLTDPCFDGETGKADTVLSVSISSIKPNRHYDDSCIFKAGTHEFIVKDSFVYYHHLRLDTAQYIEDKIQCGEFIVKDVITDEMYVNALLGIIESDDADIRFKRFLKSAIKQQACLDIFNIPT